MKYGLIFILLSLFFLPKTQAQKGSKRHVVNLTDDVRLDYEGLITDSTIPHGTYKLYWKRRLLIKGNFEKGLRNGTWIRYYPDGTTAIKAHYINDQKQGEWTYRNDKGQPLARISFTNDQPSGTWTGYYPSGKKASEILYDAKYQPSRYIHYYPSGEVVLFGEEVFSNDNHYKNTSLYFKNGQIGLFQQLRNDSLHGKHTVYHKTGAKWEDMRFTGGKLIGVGNMSTPYGTPRYFGDINDGAGQLIRYNDRGELFSKAYFERGIMTDTLLFFQKGKVIGLGTLDNGSPVGKWKLYNEYYKLSQEREYFNDGDSIEVKYLLFQSENERITGQLVNGKKQGTWKTYNVYNEITKEENYQQGFLHGPYYQYEGKVVRAKGNYEWGQKSGQWRYYNSWEKEIHAENFQDSIMLKWDFSDLESNSYLRMEAPDQWQMSALGYPEDHPSQVKTYFFKKIPGMELQKEGQITYPGINRFLGFNRKIQLGYSPFFTPPVFPGGTEEEKVFVLKNQLVSEEAAQEEVAGFTLVLYKVDEFGFPSNYKVIKKLGYGLDQLSVDVLRIMPFPEPAMFNGIPVETHVIKKVVFPEYR